MTQIADDFPMPLSAPQLALIKREKGRQARTMSSLNDQHRIAIEKLCDGHTLNQVAQILGVAFKTAWGWSKQKLFQEELVAQMGQRQKLLGDRDKSALARAQSKLETMSEAAVDRLGELSRSENEGTSLAACKVILGLAIPKGAENVTNRFVFNVETLQFAQAVMQQSDQVPSFAQSRGGVQ